MLTFEANYVGVSFNSFLSDIYDLEEMLSLHILLDTSVIHGVDILCVETPTARGQIHSHRELQRENACAGHQLWLH